MKYTNTQEIPLSMAVWLAEDQYNHIDDPKYISATGLLKSVRQIILTSRMNMTDTNIDISSQIPSSLGTAVHNAIHYAWTHNRVDAMKRLGFSDDIINRIAINPSEHYLLEHSNCIPIYLEQRAEREINGYTITGQFDFIAEGNLEDFKSTGVYSYMSGSNNEKYKLQGSIYRWLNPFIITKDVMKIQYLFTDWSKLRSTIEREKGYPPSRILSQPITLMSLEETQAWILSKIKMLEEFKNTPEDDLPFCSSEDLWQSKSVYKYYKNPTKKTRSTGNFEDYHEAHGRYLNDGSVGEIVEVKGSVKGCSWCPAFDLCRQKDLYLTNGTLTS